MNSIADYENMILKEYNNAPINERKISYLTSEFHALREHGKLLFNFALFYINLFSLNYLNRSQKVGIGAQTQNGGVGFSKS